MELIAGDCLEWMRAQPDESVDLVFGSPPYESARKYGIGFALSGQDWVNWMAERAIEMARISRGLVALVVEGQTSQFRWSATPALLMADLHRAGLHLRKPPIMHRVGIPGSGGPDWLRNDYEFVVCVSRPGRLVWSDPTALGKPPAYAPGGRPSHRRQSGQRVAGRTYRPPKLANPGNVIHVPVGGGHLGHPLAHENEAPFGVKLAAFFVRSFCPPGGVVLDPFCGSGTTGQAALENDRDFVGIDIRESQVDLSRRRLADCHVTVT